MARHGRALHGRALGIGAAFAFVAALCVPAPAGAALIPVTETTDDLLSEADDGDCALREAIEAANGNAAVDQCPAGEAEPAADTVQLGDGAAFILTGALEDDANESGDLDVNTLADSGPLTIQGGNDNGSTIDAGGIDRVIDVMASSSIEGLTIENLTISGGNLPASGGGVRNGGGSLRVSRSRIQGNAAELGGGIANQGDGTLELSASVVSDNRVASASVLAVAGGGIANQGSATVDGSVISSNEAQGTNGFPVVGAGIANIQGHGASLVITDSTIAENSISGGVHYGAGISNEAGTTLSIRNSTISGNLAPGDRGEGGGLNSFGGEVSLNHVTLAGNHADHRGEAINNLGGTAISLRASVVDNGETACAGGIASAGFNVDASASCASAVNPADLQNAVAVLDLHLVNHGGPPAGPPGSSEVPQTHALLDTSPAVDRVPTGQCFDLGTTPLATDQRGFPRPDGSGCDSGAYELAIPVPVTTGGPTSSPGTSRQQQGTRKCKRKKRGGAAAKKRCKRKKR